MPNVDPEQLAEFEAELKSRDARIYELENSTSWRVTAPLRRLSAMVAARRGRTGSGPTRQPRAAALTRASQATADKAVDIDGVSDPDESGASEPVDYYAPIGRIDNPTPQLFPPGHYYSPILDITTIRDRHESVFQRPEAVPGIDLRGASQLALLPTLAELCEDHPYGDEPTKTTRYGFENDFYSYGDALVLHGMLRMLKPRRYLEIGSGWSSALVLDVNDTYLDGSIECTLVEPYPDRLKLLLRDTDHARTTIIEKPLDAIDPSVFSSLEAGDVLFVDSSHVCRTGSDVNQLYLEIFPRLPAGVFIHVHDIFYPFEYLPRWVYEGRNWNEAYLLRAYLIDNPRIQIVWYNAYLSTFHYDTVSASLPLWGRRPGGSIWLQTI